MWNTIDVIDTGKMEKVRSIFTSDYGPRTLDISPDGKTMAVINDTVGSINRSVNFIDVASGRVSEKRVIREFQPEGCGIHAGWSVRRGNL